jgi:type I site-specific restriction endonuclease
MMANAAIERALAERKRHLLVKMAPGTGKTVMMVNQVFRLMKAGLVRRALFLVNNLALADQWASAFSSFEVEPGRKFTEIYELLNPQTSTLPGHVFVYVCTVQRMVASVLGDKGHSDPDKAYSEAGVGRLGLSRRTFDLIVADDCLLGSTSGEVSAWQSVLEYFDAIQIGLTATQQPGTAAYFQHTAFEYTHAQAVADGVLVDYDMVKSRSKGRKNNVLTREGNLVEVIDPRAHHSRHQSLEDGRRFDTKQFNANLTSPKLARCILEEIKTYADEHEREYGRFPKTLIFAANDLAGRSHADQLTAIAREVFGRGDDFVYKITSRVEKWQEYLRRFRHEMVPGVVVTVELLLKGVDLPDVEFLVILRPVKSQAVFEQLIGRGMRRGVLYPDKDHFKVFDFFDKRLLVEEDSEPPDRSGPGYGAFLLRRTMRRIVEWIARFPAGLGELDWPELERMLREIFEELGFETRHTPLARDGGFDLELACTENDKRAIFLVEVKHWTAPSCPGTKELKSFFDVVVRNPVEAGLFLSSSGFKAKAIVGRTAVERQKVRLGDRSKIITLCRQFVRRDTGDWIESRSLPDILFDDTL